MAATGGDEALVAKFAVVLPHLDERQRRLLLGDAQMLAIKPQFKADKFHGEWNYIVKPAKPTPTVASEQ